MPVTDKDRELAQKIIMRLAFMSGNIDLSGRDKRDNIANELAQHRESQWQDSERLTAQLEVAKEALHEIVSWEGEEDTVEAKIADKALAEINKMESE